MLQRPQSREQPPRRRHFIVKLEARTDLSLVSQPKVVMSENAQTRNAIGWWRPLAPGLGAKISGTLNNFSRTFWRPRTGEVVEDIYNDEMAKGKSSLAQAVKELEEKPVRGMFGNEEAPGTATDRK